MSDTMDSILGTLGGLAKKAREVGAQAIEAVDRDGTVRGTYQKGAERTKAYAKIAKLTLALNSENEELRKIYTEIGKLYFEQAKDKPEGFFAPLFAQAGSLLQELQSKETELAALKDSLKAEEAEKDIEVEITEETEDFAAIVDATEAAGKGDGE